MGIAPWLHKLGGGLDRGLFLSLKPEGPDTGRPQCVGLGVLASRGDRDARAGTGGWMPTSPQRAGPGGPRPRQWLLFPELSPTPSVPSCPLAGPLGCMVQAQRRALLPLASSWGPLVTHPEAGWSCGGRRRHLHCP